jgi:ribosomal-protein-alanine N-acetyltransferase
MEETMIESKRLEYVSWHEDDFKILKQILGNPNVCKYLPGHHQKSNEELQKWLDYYVKSFCDEKGNQIFKVILKDSDIVIGYAGLSYVKEFDKMEIMYGLAEAYWKQGYGLEMSMRMKALAVEKGLKEIIALADINNVGSNKILINTGYQFVRQIHLWGCDLFYYEQKL